MKTIIFNKLTAEIPDEELTKEIFNVDFGGQMMVQFTRLNGGSFIPTNAVNGWGDNCFDEIADQKPIIQ